MTKGWRNNTVLVERRERLARERAERRIAVIRAETALAMRTEDGGRMICRDGTFSYVSPGIWFPNS